MQIGRYHAPDIMLLDVSMPGGGIEAASEIRRLCPMVKAVMLTVSENPATFRRHCRAASMPMWSRAAAGRVAADRAGRAELRIVHHAGPGCAAADAAEAPRVDTGPAGNPLPYSPENQVLQLLSEGLMNKEIAYRLRLTEKTVKHYMTELMQKLNVRNRVEAVLITRRQAEANSTNLHLSRRIITVPLGVPIVPS